VKIIKKKAKSKKSSSQDSKKSGVISDLSKCLDSAGFRVRREKLKQGHGWRVVSGSCSTVDQNLIFLDSRLSQDDQIAFLSSKLVSLGICPVPVTLQQMPGWAREHFYS